MATEIQVRRPKFPNWIGLSSVNKRYSNKLNKWTASLPRVGDNIEITYLPPGKNNPNDRNAYYPCTGIVQDMDITTGEFWLKTDTCIILIHGRHFNYIKKSINQ